MAPNCQRPPLGCGGLDGEQCVGFDPDKLQVKRKKGRYLRVLSIGNPPPVGAAAWYWKWVIAQGEREIIDFATKEDEARKALFIIKKYKFNRYCWVGKIENPSMEYFLLGMILRRGYRRPVRAVTPYRLIPLATIPD